MTAIEQVCREWMFEPKFYLALTLLLVLALTLWPNPTGRGGINPIPLRNKGGAMDFWGNVGLFLPLGALASLALEQKTRPAWRRVLLVLGAGLLLSALIETAQLWLPTRCTDVDDVIFNSCGALLGAASALVLRVSSGSRRWLALGQKSRQPGVTAHDGGSLTRALNSSPLP